MFLGFCLVVITKNVCISAILTNATLVQGGISGSLTVWLVCMDMSLTSPSRPSCRCVGLHQMVFIGIVMGHFHLNLGHF